MPGYIGSLVKSRTSQLVGPMHPSLNFCSSPSRIERARLKERKRARESGGGQGWRRVAGGAKRAEVKVVGNGSSRWKKVFGRNGCFGPLSLPQARQSAFPPFYSPKVVNDGSQNYCAKLAVIPPPSTLHTKICANIFIEGKIDFNPSIRR